jgi:hypothetical protein
MGLFLKSLQKASWRVFNLLCSSISSQRCNKPLILWCDFFTVEFFLCHFKYFDYDFNHTQIHHISFCFNKTCKAYGNVHSLLQNVGAVHYSLMTRSMNSLLFHWSMFTIINEFTQNSVKSLDIQGHLLLNGCCLIHNFISWSSKFMVCTHFQIQFHDDFLKFLMPTNICIMISMTHHGIDSYFQFSHLDFFFKFNNWNSSKFSPSHFWINLCLI